MAMNPGAWKWRPARHKRSNHVISGKPMLSVSVETRVATNRYWRKKRETSDRFGHQGPSPIASKAAGRPWRWQTAPHDLVIVAGICFTLGQPQDYPSATNPTHPVRPMKQTTVLPQTRVTVFRISSA
ncbi:unnamed protein product, partial [Ectocarpus sp. 12 AP-2014]